MFVCLPPSLQAQQSNAQLQAKVQRLEQEVGVVRSANASKRCEEEATLNMMHDELKRLVAEKCVE